MFYENGYAIEKARCDNGKNQKIFTNTTIYYCTINWVPYTFIDEITR